MKNLNQELFNQKPILSLSFLSIKPIPTVADEIRSCRPAKL